MYDIISPYVIAFASAWIIAHSIKFIISIINNKKINFLSQLFISGGMPSSHSATTMSLVTIIGLIDGVKSGIFALASLFSIIVMYDALKVRRSSGEQGVAIHQLIKNQKNNISLPRIAMGHKPLEVVIGALLGISVGIVVFLSTL